MFKMRGCKTVPPISLCLILTVVLGLTSCGPPNRYPQFNEHAIAGSGIYDIPQWSPDGRYLAFIDRSDGANNLVVYDIEEEIDSVVAFHVDTTHFDWTSDGRLSYLRFRPDLSGSPYPAISDLRTVNVDGRNDTVAVESLLNSGDYGWLNNGQQLIILLAEPGDRYGCRDAYHIDISTGNRQLLVSKEEVGVECIDTVAISKDESLLALIGYPQGATAKLVVYDLRERRVVSQFSPREAIPPGDLGAPPPSLSIASNLGWLPGNEWLVGEIGAPSGPCYRGGLFFLNVLELADSFCIPTADEGIIYAPTVSPDVTMISYITVLGPGSEYLMLGEVPAEIRDRLQISDEELIQTFPAKTCRRLMSAKTM
jgi:hypothetical protein